MKELFISNVSRIEPGDYTGYIQSKTDDPKKGRIWFNILINNTILNVPLSKQTHTYNKFAEDFVVDGYVDTDDFVNNEVEVSVSDYTINGIVYSRITRIKVLKSEVREV